MIKLSKIPTRPPKDVDKKTLQEQTKKNCKEIAKLQAVMIAQSKYNLLVVFQGMDASGKDGAVKNVFKYCNPSGIKVKGFKKPTDEEFGHDFLWRIHKNAPQKGMIQIFVRSHYEDVLIQRVHKWISEEHAIKRINAINAFEELLEFDNNTIILKFYLHLSFEQQAIELQQRLDDPTKYWKHNPGDWEERKHWDEYMRCYEDVLERSSIPWKITPVDERWYRDYVVSTTIVEAMRKLDLQYPKLEI